MAKYTISILDKLIENAAGKDLTDFQNLTDVSKNVLFGSELNVISEQYRDRFALGFAQEFMFDEIGLETFAAWRMALSHRVFDLAEKINWTFENLDKQVFANYAINKRTVNTESSGTSKTDGVLNVTADGTTATTATNSNTGSQSDTTTDTSKTTNSETGKVSNLSSNDTSTAKTGTETTSKNESGESSTVYGKTVTDSNSETGTVKQNVDGDVVDEKTIAGSIDKVTDNATTMTGTENDNKTYDGNGGSVSKTPALTETRSEQEGNRVTEKEISYSDTPQNELSAVKDGNYLTNFTYQKETETPHLYATTTTESLVASETETDNRNWTEKNAHTFDNRKDSTTGSEKTSYSDYVEKNTHDDNSTQTETRDLTNARTEKNSGSDSTTTKTTGSDTTTRDLTDTTNSSTTSTENSENSGTSNTENSGTLSRNTENNSKSEGSDTMHNESTNTNTSKTTNDATANTIETVEHFDFNYEMLMKSVPYLKNLWREFDDLFMILL